MLPDSPMAPDDRRHHDDRAAAARAHLRDRELRAQHGAGEVGVEHAVPVLERHRLRRARARRRRRCCAARRAGRSARRRTPPWPPPPPAVVTSPANTAASPPSAAICRASASARPASRLTSTTFAPSRANRIAQRHAVAHAFAARRRARDHRHLPPEPVRQLAVSFPLDQRSSIGPGKCTRVGGLLTRGRSRDPAPRTAAGRLPASRASRRGRRASGPSAPPSGSRDRTRRRAS